MTCQHHCTGFTMISSQVHGGSGHRTLAESTCWTHVESLEWNCVLLSQRICGRLWHHRYNLSLLFGRAKFTDKHRYLYDLCSVCLCRLWPTWRKWRGGRPLWRSQVSMNPYSGQSPRVLIVMPTQRKLETHTRCQTDENAIQMHFYLLNFLLGN